MNSANWQNAADRAAAHAPVTGPRGRSIGKAPDPAEILPPEALARLSRLREIRDDTRTILLSVSDRQQELHRDRMTADAHFRALTDRDHAFRAGGNTYVGLRPEGEKQHPEVEKQTKKLAALDQELKALKEKYEALNWRWSEIGQLVRKAEEYLASLPDIELTLHNGKEPKLQRGESIEQAVERIREQRASLQADLHAIKSAPIKLADAKAGIRKQIEALAERGQPNILRAVEKGGDIRWPTMRAEVATEGMVAAVDGKVGRLAGAASAAVPDTLAMFAWMFQQELTEALEHEADLLADDDGALDDMEREAKIADVLDKILANERDEAALTWESKGDVVWRGKIDPRAALGIVGPQPEVRL